MSWLSNHYEKVALGGAVAVALGLAYLGWSKLNSVEEDFASSLRGVGNNKTRFGRLTTPGSRRRRFL